MALRACGRSMVMIANPSSNSRSTIDAVLHVRYWHSRFGRIASPASTRTVPDAAEAAQVRSEIIPRRAGQDATRHEGWWTPETLGDLVADGLRGQSRHRLPRAFGGAALRGHLRATSNSSPAGSPPGLRAARRRPRRRGRAAAAELDGGRRRVLGVGVPRRGGGADRALLRPQGTRPHHRDGRPTRLHHRRGVRADDVPAGPVRGRPDRRAGR